MMKDSPHLSSAISAETKQAVIRVLEALSENFNQLVALTGLDSAVDFRFRDLEYVNFDNADLRGFDFTGASLVGATGKDCIIDHTTILSGAVTTDSIFEERDFHVFIEPIEAQRLSKLPWTDQLIWLAKLRPNDSDYAEKLDVAINLLSRTKEGVVKRDILQRLATQTDDITGFLRYLSDSILSDGSDVKSASAGFHALSALAERSKDDAIKFALGLLGGKWAAEAAVFLAEHMTENGIRPLSKIIASRRNSVLRQRYITALAVRFAGSGIFVREPLTDDVFDFEEEILESTIDLMTRSIFKKYMDEMALPHKGPLHLILGTQTSAEEVKFSVWKKLKDLRARGLNFTLPGVINNSVRRFSSPV